MLKRLKQLFRAFFTLNKSEQWAITIILFALIFVFIINLFLPQFIHHPKADFKSFETDIEAFRQAQQTIFDSIKVERLQNRGELDLELAQQKLKPFKFDPNDLPVELWKQMGLTEKQIRMIKNYENKGGSFRQKEDFKRMYCISDVEYQILEPYISIKSPFRTMPDNRLEKTKAPISKSKKKKPAYEIIELNASDTSDLTTNLHLPKWLARRIIKYRELLGGFAVTNQLTEVYGFDSSRLLKISKYLVVDQTQIHKLNLNESTFKELLKHPYISYETTKVIVNYRDKKGDFKSVNELLNKELISEPLFIKLKPYLIVGEPE